MGITDRKCAVCGSPATKLVHVRSAVEDWNYCAFLCDHHAYKVESKAWLDMMGAMVWPVEELRNGA